MRYAATIYLRTGVNEHVFDVTVYLHALGSRLGDYISSISSFSSRIGACLVSEKASPAPFYPDKYYIIRGRICHHRNHLFTSSTSIYIIYIYIYQL